MRMTQRFGKNLREIPAEVELPSHGLMLRAALISRVAAGIYDYLPLAWRSIKKIEDIIRKEMDAIEGQELNMPVVHPADLWQESGRWYDIGSELVRFKDRSGRDMVLAMTHEETVTDLARRHIDSYRQLPSVVYQIQTKFRDEPRSRGGLIRVREFIMKDAYSFHDSAVDLDDYYPSMCRAYRHICTWCGIPVVQVLSDVGMMGGNLAHEFTYVTDYGEDTLILCSHCGYAANREVATIGKGKSRAGSSAKDTLVSESRHESGPPERVHTPGCDTISAVAEYLHLSPQETIKTMVYVTSGKDAVMVAIRGDLEINERKLANFLKTPEVRLADGQEITGFGLVQGYMSPVGISKMKVVVDDSLLDSQSYVAGANQEGFHLKNVVPGRDFVAKEKIDVTSAREGDACPTCGMGLSVKRGIEIGNTFKLGTKYSKTMGAYYQDEQGNLQPLIMGCYGIGVGRLLGCAIEANHDHKGLVWPATIAPYHVYLVALGRDDRVTEVAEEVYSRLTDRGIEVLYDDRDESAGVKFNDADLLGLPIRVTVSRRSLDAGGLEVKLRRQETGTVISVDHIESSLESMIQAEIRRFEPEREGN